MRFLLAASVLVITGSFSCGARDWPHWAEQLVSELDCGMTIQEVERRAEGELSSETRLREFGSHVIRREGASLWLDFENNRLQSVMLSQLVPWQLKGTRVSPQRNLCTGELSFFLRLNHAKALEGATVYIDGREIEDYPWGYPFEISSGSHELRVEKQGYEPITKELHFEKDDPGEVWLDITGEDVRPLPQGVVRPQPAEPMR